jgi:cellulose synthase/poly-beta-1,6-N-acetylglucosamine synthase-like glycosyltransferase
MTPFHQHAITNPTIALVVFSIEVVLFSYFLFVNLFYIGTTLVAFARLPSFIKGHLANPVVPVYSSLELPVTVAVPAYNEQEHIVQTVDSLLQLEYSEFEIVVVNDGSTDETLKRLSDAFSLEPFPQPYRDNIPTQRVRQIYVSQRFPNLRVIDKLNGGKGDALNAAINCARYPLFFATDADSHYTKDALQCMAEPFLLDPETVVCGATVGVGNDCTFEDGAMTGRRLSKRWVVRFQILEYMRAFLSSRLGWAPLNSLLIVSGACGLWRREVLQRAGGYRTDTIWEDLEMTTRVHHMLRKERRRYRIAFTPFAVCWTTVPDTLEELWNQRVGWHRHLSEATSLHRKMFLGRHCGTMGWLGFPFLVLGEFLAPLMVIFGVIFSLVAAYFGFLWYGAQLILLMLVAALAILVSMGAILLDEISFKTYSPRELLILLVAAPLELFGFRAFITAASFVGFWHWLRSRPARGRRDLSSWNARPYDPMRSPNWRGKPSL